MSSPVVADPASRPTRARYAVVAVLFGVTALNYADRATLSIVGPSLTRDLEINTVTLGYLLSAFSWTYMLCQVPGGWIIDRFGALRVYQGSILLWSVFTGLQGFTAGLATWFPAIGALFCLRILLGAAESPSFPANSRIVASWFPTAERGFASAVFNSAQYFSTVLFYPLMGLLTHHFGWPSVFWVMGGLGLIVGMLWPRWIKAPAEHPWANAAEVRHIEAGGGLVDLDGARTARSSKPNKGVLGQLLRNRMLLGIFGGQYCINVLTWFFLTWFPIYLVKERGLTILKVGFIAVLPALCGFLGGLLGGWISDQLLRRGHSLSFARKAPIVAGLLLSTAIVACNAVDSTAAVIFCMSLAYFGKGVGALGWAVMSDVAPKTATGLAGGLFNTFGNFAGAISPVIIGYLIKQTGTFHLALVYVGLHGLFAIACYLLIVGEIKRVELR